MNQTGDARDQIREGLASVLVQPFAFDRRQLHQSPRGRTSAGRRAGTKILDCQIEKRGEALSQGPRAECLLKRAEILARIALVGAEKQCFLAAKGIVEAAALDARLTRD